MRITKEHNILILQLIQAANFGSASGNFVVDSPTQKEAYLNLPFIPDSAIKGVLKDSFNGNSKLKNSLKTVFGDPGSDIEESKTLTNGPGKLIVGNGDLIAFPLLTKDGKRCWIFPVGNVLKLLKLWHIANNEKLSIPMLSSRFFDNDNNKKTILLNVDELHDLGIDLEWIREIELKDEIVFLKKILFSIASELIPKKEPWLIISNTCSAMVWNMATEIRTLTALSKEKTAKAQSLRKIEVIPESSIFFSFTSWLGDSALEFPDEVIQVGGFEGIGLGWLRIFLLEEIDLSAAVEYEIMAHGIPVEKREIIMKKMFEKINALERKPSEFKKNVKTVVSSFASKTMENGFEAAIAFELAKAKMLSSKRSSERDAHKWLLLTLLEKTDLSLVDFEELFRWPFSQKQKSDWLLKLNYLRKYSEIMLD